MASGKNEGGNFNPFRNKKKEVSQLKLFTCLPVQGVPHMTLIALLQDAAKKALEEMFGGQQDVLAAYDAGGGNSGKVCDKAMHCTAAARSEVLWLANAIAFLAVCP